MTENDRARLAAYVTLPGDQAAHQLVLVILSPNTATIGQLALISAAKRSLSQGHGSRLNWWLLLGLATVLISLVFYFSQLEAVMPLRKLREEFDGVTQGTHRQIFHEQYSGIIAAVAKSADRAYHAVRNRTVTTGRFPAQGIAKSTKPQNTAGAAISSPNLLRPNSPTSPDAIDSQLDASSKNVQASESVTALMRRAPATVEPSTDKPSLKPVETSVTPRQSFRL